MFDNSIDGSVFACQVTSCLNQGLSKNSNRKVSLHISILPRLLRCLRCRGGSSLKQQKSNSSFSKIWGDDPWIWTCPKCDARRVFEANYPTGFADECVLEVAPMTSYNSSLAKFSDGEPWGSLNFRYSAPFRVQSQQSIDKCRNDKLGITTNLEHRTQKAERILDAIRRALWHIGLKVFDGSEFDHGNVRVLPVRRNQSHGDGLQSDATATLWHCTSRPPKRTSRWFQ